jgi:hypothetical protein
MTEKEIYDALDCGEPPQELLEWAKENLGEDPETKCQIISDFRDMIYGKFLQIFHQVRVNKSLPTILALNFVFALLKYIFYL